MKSLRQSKIKTQSLCTMHCTIPELSIKSRQQLLKCTLFSDLFTEISISVNTTAGNYYSRINSYVYIQVSIIHGNVETLI